MPSETPQTITSRDNTLLRLARAVRDGKEKDLIFIEGLRLCEEALRSSLKIDAIIYSDEIANKERANSFIEAGSGVSRRMAVTTEKLLATISYTKTPQGVIALAQKPDTGVEQLSAEDGRPALLVVMHRLNNPVNIGAILRSAEAAGVTGVVATVKTADPFSPKSLRGAMGSAFRLPIWTGPEYGEVLSWCADQRITTTCAHLEATTLYTDLDWRIPRALIVGPEATGLNETEVAAANEGVRIPMQGEVESLNVAVAAGILLYEAARQRHLELNLA